MQRISDLRHFIQDVLEATANNGLSYCIAEWNNADGGDEIYLIRTDGQMIHVGDHNCTGSVDDVSSVYSDIVKWIEPYNEDGKLILDEYWDSLGPSFAPLINQFYSGMLSFDEIFEASLQTSLQDKKLKMQ